METLIILVGAAGIAATVVWWGSTPAAPRVQAQRPSRRAALSRLRRSRPRPFTLPAPEPERPVRAAPPVHETLVLEPSTVPDDRPSALWALLRLAFTIAFVAAVGVALLAALWLVVNNQLASYLAR